MKRSRRVRTVVALAALGLTLGVSAPRTSAAGVLDFTVDRTTAVGGVFARFEPHNSAAIRVVGYGMYPSQTARLLCGVTDGDPVGPYNNHTWHYVSDLNNPGEGNFWINDHYLDTPIVANQLVPGEPRCGNETGNPVLVDNGNHTTTVSGQVSNGLGQPSLFVSGSSDPTGATGVQVATQDINGIDLAQAGCSPAVLSEMIPGVATLAAWSKGRIGVLMYLKHAGPERFNALHYIVLIDPGSAADIAPSCDGTPPPGNEQYDANSFLVQWLSLSPANQLLIVTGQDTEDRSWGGFGGPTFNGLKQYYLAGVAQWDRTPGHVNLSQQVLVCDYNYAGHAQLMQDLFMAVQRPASSMCPVALNGDLPPPVVEQPYP